MGKSSSYRYSADVRGACLRALASGERVEQLAARLDIPERTLRRWRAVERPRSTTPAKRPSSRRRTSMPTVSPNLAGVEGFREAHNDSRIEARRHQLIHQRIEKFVDQHLRRSRYLAQGGDPEAKDCPRGWIRDNEGPKLALVSTVDWAAHRSDFEHLQVTKDPDTSKAVLFWVDPDDVASYQQALED